MFLTNFTGAPSLNILATKQTKMNASGRQLGCGCNGTRPVTGKENAPQIRRSTSTYYCEEIRTVYTEEVRTEQYSKSANVDPKHPFRTEDIRKTRAPLLDVNERQLIQVPQKIGVPPQRIAARTAVSGLRTVVPPTRTKPTQPVKRVGPYIPQETSAKTSQSLPITSTIKKPKLKPSQSYTKDWVQSVTNSTKSDPYYTASSSQSINDSFESCIPDLEASKYVNFERGISYDSSEMNDTDSGWNTIKTSNDADSYMPYKVIPKVEARKSLAYYREPLQPITEIPNQLMINDGIPSLRKKTLRRSIPRQSEYRGVVNLDQNVEKIHPCVLYTEYMFEIIDHILTKEDQHTLEPYFIRRSDVSNMRRAAVVNWLIKLQQHLGSDSTVFFTSIRLFDKIISISHIDDKLLQLIGVVCFWISCKLGDIIDVPTGSKILELCNSAFTYKQIYKTECNVLNLLKFNITVEEPMLFVRYYIYNLQLENSNIVSICSNYLLDCFMLDPESNTIPVSLQGAAAVLLSLKLLRVALNRWLILKSYPGYHSLSEMTNVHGRMTAMVRMLQEEQYKYREIYYKYSTEKNGSISLKLNAILSN